MSESETEEDEESCCCCKLETGGIIIGWLSTLVNFGFSLFFIYCIISWYTNEAVIIDDSEKLEERRPIVFLCAGYFVFAAFISYGTGVTAVKKRDPRKLRIARLMWAVLAIGFTILVLMAFLSLWSSKGDPVIKGSILAIGIVCTAILFYILASLSCLIEKFREERGTEDSVT